MKFIEIKQDTQFCSHISSAHGSHEATDYNVRDKNMGCTITKSSIGNTTVHKANFGYKVDFELKKKKPKHLTPNLTFFEFIQLNCNKNIDESTCQS